MARVDYLLKWLKCCHEAVRDSQGYILFNYTVVAKRPVRKIMTTNFLCNIPLHYIVFYVSIKEMEKRS